MTATQNYGNIILSTPILSADPNVKEDVMTDQQKITILYCRLSNEDSQDRESNSIQNQRELLTRYARDHGYTNLKVLVDDGYTGTNFQRPGVQEGFELVKQGLVGCWLCKDLSRFGRDYLTVGQYTDIIFPSYDVRFIAINDGVDSQRGDGEGFAAIRNLFNEWYPRDTSKKVRTSLLQRGTSGKHLGKPPYGYRCDPNDKDKWILDEDAAPIVKRIFDLCIDGKGPEQISRILERDQVLTTKALYASRKGKPLPKNPYGWSDQSIVGILERQEYTGCTCNFKTYSKSYKLKKRYEIPEEQQIVFENTHEAIINQEDWDTVQRIRAHRRHPVKQGEPALFSGMLFCADCGSLLRVHRGKTISKHQECYCCGRYRDRTNACSMHYIRELVLADLMKENLKQVVRLASEDEQEFVRRLTNRNAQEQAAQERTLKNELATKEQRIKELDGIIKRLYEDNITGKLSDERFKIFSTDYEDEQHSLREEVASLKQQLEDMESTSVNVSGFLKAAQRYTDFDELTPSMLHDLIEKIIVHEGDKSSGHREQRIEIYYTFIGAAEGSQIIVKRKRKAA